jgi:hypothetical protein
MQSDTQYIAALSASEKDGHLETAAELEALDSIYPGAIRLLSTSGGSGGSATPPPPPPPSVLPPLPTAGQRLRYQLAIPVSDDEPDGARLRVLVSLPSAYPASESAPQLMLCGRYIGAFAIDAGLCESRVVRGVKKRVELRSVLTLSR